MCGTSQRSIRISTGCFRPFMAIVSAARLGAACAGARMAVNDSTSNAKAFNSGRFGLAYLLIASPQLDLTLYIPRHRINMNGVVLPARSLAVLSVVRSGPIHRRAVALLGDHNSLKATHWCAIRGYWL